MSQPFFCEGSEAMVALEAMVDKAGLRNVFYALAHIAAEKADHLQANWQDEASAKRWAYLSKIIDSFAHHQVRGDGV